MVINETDHIFSAYISGKLNGKTEVAVKITWDKEYSLREKKILGILDAENPSIEAFGIPRIYYAGPIFQVYDAIVMTLFDGDLESRWKKQNEHMNDLSILMIFKRSVN